MKRARIISTGYYLPEKILTNKDLEKMVDTSDEWITKRTGIKTRHIAAPDEAASDMGIKAARMAISKASINTKDIDMIICATITPDHLFPSTAAVMQNKLGIKNSSAFDLSAACSGYIYALSVAESFLLQNKADNVLVVASEKLSCITDWEDRNTCVLFGDGAGAALLQRSEGESGILSSYLQADGSLGDLLILPAGGSRKPASKETLENRDHYLKMEGNEVFKVAVRRMIEASKKSISDAGIEPEDIRLVIPHQANKRIIEAIRTKLNLTDDRVYTNLDHTGNTSAASIAIAMGEGEDKGRIKTGDIINIVSFGGGFTWAGMTIKW
ncbi:MAG: beta-ketoacyl-ACP synthase III [Chitinivibrionales bacterium]